MSPQESHDFFRQVLQKTPFAWTPGKSYEIEMRAEGNRLSAAVREEGSRNWAMTTAVDEDHPYLTGAVGAGLLGPSHMSLRKMTVKSLGEAGASDQS